MHQSLIEDKITLKIQYLNKTFYYLLPYAVTEQVTISKNCILKGINTFLVQSDIRSDTLFQIYVITPTGKQSLNRIKAQQLELLISSDIQNFYVPILLEDLNINNEPLKLLAQSNERYFRLNEDINEIIENSKKEEIRFGQKSQSKEIYAINVAYLFADPLVQISSNGMYAVSEVSYQKQYDIFITRMKKEMYKNVHIKMMIANEVNIRRVLLDGSAVLHFSCHGKKNILQIQSDANIGEDYELSTEKFLKILQNKTLPKLILFNACDSKQIAQQVFDKLHITTIGYEGSIPDIICEFFTEKFYEGIFKKQKSIRTLFHQIKHQIQSISQDNAKEAKKMHLFCSQHYSEESERIITNLEQSLDWIKKWNFVENMRQNEPIGIQKELYNFIKTQLNNSENISYMFVVGRPQDGKSTFMEKIKIYTMNRNLFNEELTLDLRKKQIDNMLQFKIEYEKIIDHKINLILSKEREKRVNTLIILDHCTEILTYEYQQFMEFMINKIFRRIKYGKIVIITNHIQFASAEDRIHFQCLNCYDKEQFILKDIDLRKYISRWCPSEIKNEKTMTQIMKEKAEKSPVLIIQALKKARSSVELSIELNRQESSLEFSRKLSFSLNFNLEFEKQHEKFSIEALIKKAQDIIDNYLKKGVYKIKDNDFLFLSTILQESKLEKNECETIPIIEETERLAKFYHEQFKTIISRCFIMIENRQKLITSSNDQELEDDFFKNHLSKIIKFSLRIPEVCFLLNQSRSLQKEFEKEFIEQIYNCYRLYIKVKYGYKALLKKQENKHILDLIKKQEINILLTLYGYFSQKMHNLKWKEQMNEKDRVEQQNNFKQNAEVIWEQIRFEYEKPSSSDLFLELYYLKELNEMIQQFSNREEYQFHSYERKERINTEYDVNIDMEVDIDCQLSEIEDTHRKVVEYKRLYDSVVKINHLNKHGFKILKKPTEDLILINILKLMHRCITLIEKINLFKMSNNLTIKEKFLPYYSKILDQVISQQIFMKNHHNKGLFKYDENLSVKVLHKQYMKGFIIVMFKLEKLKEYFEKEYKSLHIYQNLIEYSIANKFTSTKKEIEEYTHQHYFNNCVTFIALPLTYLNTIQKEYKINIKRYQRHVERFVEHLFKNIIDKELHSEIENMSAETLESYSCRKVLIYLVVCDCRVTEKFLKLGKLDNTIYLENQFGMSEQYLIDKITLLDAPLVVYFGQNVRVMKNHYEHSKIKTILMYIDLKFQNLNQQPKKAVDPKVDEVSARSMRKEIYYSVLQCFYSSFCRIFFNEAHQFFIDQYSKSFALSKAETLIKTKMKFCSISHSNCKREIQEIVDSIEMVPINFKDEELKKMPAYCSAYKSKRKLNPEDVIQEKCFQLSKQNRLECQIGANSEVCEALKTIVERIDAEKEPHLVVHYTNKEFKHEFVKTLKSKFLKSKFFLNGIIQIPRQQQNEHYHDYRQNKAHLEESLFIFNDIKPQYFKHQLRENARNRSFKIFLLDNFDPNQQLYLPIILTQTIRSHFLEMMVYYVEHKIHCLLDEGLEKKFKQFEAQIFERERNGVLQVSTFSSVREKAVNLIYRSQKSK